jgi:hypothetical protein
MWFSFLAFMITMYVVLDGFDPGRRRSAPAAGAHAGRLTTALIWWPLALALPCVYLALATG